MAFTTKSNKQLINDLQTDVDALVGASGLEIDEVPTQNSSNAVTSNGVYNAFANIDLSSKQDKIEYNYDIPGVILTKLSEKQDLLDGQSEIKVRKLEMNGSYGLDIEYQTISGNTIYLSTQNLYYKNSSSQNTLLNTTLDALQSAIDIIDISGKQDTIIDNSLSISHVSNLQTALDGKATTSDLSNKQDIITDNSLSISHVSNLQTALDSKKSNFTLLAGDNITFQNGISADGDIITISASGGGSSGVTYTEGSNIDITADDVIKVEDNPSFTNSVIAGGTKIGGIGGSASFSQSSFTDWVDSALIQWDTGHTIINCKLNKEIYFRNGGIGSRTFAKIDNSGEFHIYRDGSLQNLNTLIDSNGSNQLSRMSYYSGSASPIPSGITDFYYNTADEIHNNLNIPFTNQTDNASSGWFLSEGTYKIEYKCNFDNGSYGNRLGIKNTFIFNGAEYLPGECYGFGRHNAYIDKQTVDTEFIYTVPANGEYMKIKNNCALANNQYNSQWGSNISVHGGFALIFTRIDQIDAVSPSNLTFDAPLVETNDIVSIDLSSKQDVLTAGNNITIAGNVISAGGGTSYQAGEGINIIDDVISSSLISDTNDYLEILFTRVGHMQDADDTLPTAYSFFGHSFSWTPQSYAIKQDLYVPLVLLSVLLLAPTTIIR